MKQQILAIIFLLVLAGLIGYLSGPMPLPVDMAIAALLVMLFVKWTTPFRVRQ